MLASACPNGKIGKCTLEHFKENCPLRTLEMAFQSIKISKYSMGKKPPDPHSGSPSQQTCDSLMTRKYPDFTYSKGWTVCITMCIYNSAFDT